MRKDPNPKAKWKGKLHKYPEASRIHNRVRELMLSGRFLFYRAFQEVPLKDLVENYNGGMRVDWYVEDLNLVIELHGKQHYEQTSFGAESKLTSNFNWIASKDRDSNKKGLLQDAGYLFVEIPYSDESILTQEYLLQKIGEALDASSRKID